MDDIKPDNSNHFYSVNKSGGIDLRDLKTGELVSSHIPVEQRKKEVEIIKYKYTQYIGSIICQKVMEGETLTKIGRTDGFPSFKVIQRWRHMHQDFDEALRLAENSRAAYHHEKMLDDVSAADFENIGRDELNALKYKHEVIKWSAEKGDPKKFGKDKTEQGASAPTTIIVNTGINRDYKGDSEIDGIFEVKINE